MSAGKLDFGRLDQRGTEYHRWCGDVRNALTAKSILPTIEPHNEELVHQPNSANKAQAIIIMKRHLETPLLWQYMNVNNPRDLWVALADRFGNIADTLLPDLKEKWTHIRFQDFKSVADFDSEMLKLRSMLEYCNQNVTEADMLEKTLSTFPIAARMLANQYRNEVRTGNITTYNQLIQILAIAEKHDSVLVNNSSRPLGTKRVPEANYGSAPRKDRNPRKQGRNEGRQGPYNRPKTDHYARGNRERGAPTNRGRQGNRGSHGGAPSYADKGKAKVQQSRDKGEKRGNGVCHRCGASDHWFKNCRASKVLADAYKTYRDKLTHESYYNETEERDDAEANLVGADFKIGRNSIEETPDFD